MFVKRRSHVRAPYLHCVIQTASKPHSSRTVYDDENVNAEQGAGLLPKGSIVAKLAFMLEAFDIVGFGGKLTRIEVKVGLLEQNIPFIIALVSLALTPMSLSWETSNRRDVAGTCSILVSHLASPIGPYLYQAVRCRTPSVPLTFLTNTQTICRLGHQGQRNLARILSGIQRSCG